MPSSPIDVTSLFKNGNFAVIQGGPSFLNHHSHSSYQRYALDIVKVSGPLISSRKRILPPDSLEDFAIYKEPIFSPCSGKIVKIIKNIGERAINDRNNISEKDKFGNYIIIVCEHRYKILLAHLKIDSIPWDEGSEVTKGDLLGIVGNSGNSSEPHLHIQVNDISTNLSKELTYFNLKLIRNFLIFL